MFKNIDIIAFKGLGSCNTQAMSLFKEYLKTGDYVLISREMDKEGIFYPRKGDNLSRVFTDP